MFLRRPVLAGALAVTALVATACGSSAPGGDGKTAGGDKASAADAAAKALGIDLSKCGTDPTAPLTGTVKVGQTLALSGGPAATFAPIGAAVKAAFENFNATSGLSTKFEIVQADDQFAPAKALTATQQLIDKDKVVAMTSTIGTPQVIAIQSLLDTECIPAITGLAGGANANSPTKHPWTTIFTLPSTVDARSWVENVTDKYPDGAKIGVFYANDESGKAYVAAIKKYLTGTKSTIVASQSIENSDAAAPASQVTTLRSSGANVLMAAPTGAQCLPLMQQVASQGWKPAFYMSSTCPSSLFDLAGAAADGVYVNQYVKDPTRAPFNTDPGVQAFVATMKKYSPNTAINSTSLAGYVYSEPFFAAVKAAAASPLGLSRLGLLVATTKLNFQPTTTYPGVKFSLNYPNDVVAMEAAELIQYDAAGKLLKPVKLYDFEGKMTGEASQ